MSLTTKDSHFIFDGTLYKQIDGVAMGSLLGPQHLKRFQSYLNYRHAKISLTIENEKRNRMSFFDVNVICEQGKFTTSVYRKPTFSGNCTHFNSFLSSTYKTDIINTLLYRFF